MNNIIFGNINADGTIKSGAGFEVVHDITGEYTILFDKHFSSVPAVVTLQNFPSWDNFQSDGGDVRDNTVLIAVNAVKCKVKAGDSNGSASNRNFSFIAIGD